VIEKGEDAAIFRLVELGLVDAVPRPMTAKTEFREAARLNPAP